jgi:transcriptional regulator with XRE-family HTH domain
MSIQLAPRELVQVTSIDDTQRKLGRLIRLNRRALELTQTGLGARVGLNQSQICKFEQNGATSFEIFLKASRGLDLPAWVLLKVAEDPDAFEEVCSVKSKFRSAF